MKFLLVSLRVSIVKTSLMSKYLGKEKNILQIKVSKDT